MDVDPTYGPIGALEPITLDEMDSIRLMNRVDTKFLLTEDQLRSFIEKAAGKYRILTTQEGTINTYDTIYYDTGDLRMYLDHHNRRLVRRKVRVRTYVASGDTFLEVKRKNNHGRTKKKRIPFDGTFGEAESSFLEEKSGYRPEEISPTLRTAFRRVTLVNVGKTERLTIDTELSFENFRTGLKDNMGDAVIMELKQDGLAPSDALKILWELRVKPFKISKYCIGTAMTSPALKQNRFKTKIRRIRKLTDNSKTI